MAYFSSLHIRLGFGSPFSLWIVLFLGIYELKLEKILLCEAVKYCLSIFMKMWVSTVNLKGLVAGVFG